MNSYEARLLNRVMQNSQMGIAGIDGIIDRASGPIRPVLEAQKKEYIKTACEARKLLREGGVRPKNVPHASLQMADRMGRVKTALDSSPQHMAKMLVRGSTMGTVSLCHELNSYRGPESKAKALSKKLLKTEEANIQQLKPFL